MFYLPSDLTVLPLIMWYQTQLPCMQPSIWLVLYTVCVYHSVSLSETWLHRLHYMHAHIHRDPEKTWWRSAEWAYWSGYPLPQCSLITQRRIQQIVLQQPARFVQQFSYNWPTSLWRTYRATTLIDIARYRRAIWTAYVSHVTMPLWSD